MGRYIYLYCQCKGKFVIMFVKTEFSCSVDGQESADWFSWLIGGSGLFGWHDCWRENVKFGLGAAFWRSFAYSVQKDDIFAIHQSSEVVADFAWLSGLWWTFSKFQNERQNWKLIRKQAEKNHNACPFLYTTCIQCYRHWFILNE